MNVVMILMVVEEEEVAEPSENHVDIDYHIVL
jgi:hypothetical protein